MDTISIKTRAKINLTLDILNKRKDGYHNVSMVMQSVDLYDVLHFKTTNNEIRVFSDDSRLPVDGQNLVYKAVERLRQAYGINSGVEVFIEKRIPISAGLAGGSTNAAGTLKALNLLWDLNLSEYQLAKIGQELGADVPFCIIGGTALAEGTGEVLTALNNRTELNIVLVKPDIEISTPWAYSLVDVESIGSHPDNDKMIDALNRGDVRSVADNLSNVFEYFVFAEYPQLGEIKLEIEKLGAVGQLMSGSGPTVYGIFTSEIKAKKAAEAMSSKYKDVFVTKSFNERGARFEL